MHGKGAMWKWFLVWTLFLSIPLVSFPHFSSPKPLPTKEQKSSSNEELNAQVMVQPSSSAVQVMLKTLDWPDLNEGIVSEIQFFHQEEAKKAFQPHFGAHQSVVFQRLCTVARPSQAP
jgi:hypothetical protein